MELIQQITNAREQTVETLVRAAQRGEREAFDELFQRYERAVYATAFRRLGNHAEAQELTQEVFIQAMRKIGQLKNPVCFGGWVRAIAGRMAINRAIRAKTPISVEAEKLEAQCADQQTPLANVLTEERRNQVHNGLDRLPAMDRATLWAFYFQGQSLAQMSDEFDSPVGTIKRRLHVARKRLARELEELAPAC